MNIPHSIFTVPENRFASQASASGPNRIETSLRRSSTPENYLAPERFTSAASETLTSEARTAGQIDAPIATSKTLKTLSNLSWKSGTLSKQDRHLQQRSRSVSISNVPKSEAADHNRIVHGIKRPLPPEFLKPIPPFKDNTHKKARGVFIRPRHTLDPSTFPKGPPVSDLQPPSPLFFSNSRRARPPLPPRFSSSEAGVTMLNKAGMEEGSKIRTVKMARGVMNFGNSPPRAASTPSGQLPVERSSLSMSRGLTPNDREASSDSQGLGQIGVEEFLELDDRPTFIIDLANQANYKPGPIHLAYVNLSLRGYPGLLSLIAGNATEESPGLAAATTFPEFKAWATSFVKNNESLDVCLPSFLYAGINWTCSTLRKRFRIINGSLSQDPNSIGSNPPSTGTPVIPSFANTLSNSFLKIDDRNTKLTLDEPADYFGDTQVPISPNLALKDVEEVIPTVEKLDETKVAQNGEPVSNGIFNVTSRSNASESSEPSSPLGTRYHEAILGAATASRVDSFESPTIVDQGFFDWTRLPVTPALPRHIQFARSIDWASTSLGPIETWPAALRGMCNLIMASPHPAAMYWGDDLIAIYNEPYILLAGQKHPTLMGQSYRVAWSEIWDAVKDVFANARITGQATMKDDDCLFMRRSGFLEETYFSWSIIPLVGDDGSVVGLYNPAFEKTRRKIAERRMLTLREVGEKTAAAREVKGFWGQVLKGLQYNEHDTPFVLLYSITEDTESDVSSVHSASIMGTKQCILEGTLPAVPENHKAAPSQIDLKMGAEGFGPVFREALTSDRPILLETEKGTLDIEMIEGIDWRGFGEMPRAAVVCPIQPTIGDGNSILGFLVMGINPRRPYDDDYNLFVQLLSRQLATSMASVVLFEEEIRRGQRAARLAALDRIELSEQLAIRTQEAVESETKFTRMAEFAPVGMFIANSNGKITYCNDMFYEISRHPKEEDNSDDWMNVIKDEDKDFALQWWSNLVENKVPMTAEFRFKAPWQDRNGTLGDTWVLASAYPEKYDNGDLKSVFGSITNISQQKWAEDFQKRRMEEAVELKRQQESFIDTTSHEMRNPLSAIVQCADEISTSLSNYKATSERPMLPIELIDSNIDAAQTIALCANHQTRIVSDILTLSKLDSALLLVTPVDTQPVSVVQQTLKMFSGELQTADIRMQLKTDPSWETMQIDWVRLDPSRLLQVLINLTTNAIKFTTGQPKRTITVTLSASLKPPSEDVKPWVSYIPTRRNRKDTVDSLDWGDGQEVFVHFAVEDTGRGLNDSEKKLLFLRFSQASPKTHVQYGGSGLGLFISRELVELQGGEIGVSSESGRGSTFAFYIKARKSSAPTEGSDQSIRPVTLGRTSLGRATRISHSGRPAYLDSTTVRPQAIPSKDLKVLIVEDNLVNQRVLQKQLRNLGCTVHVANHGGECLDRLKDSRYWIGHEDHGLQLSVILMDLEMPIMDGLTCAKKIRELQRKGDIVRHVPIIAVTANARVEQISTALESGMDDVVSKPFRIPDLIPKIEELIARYKDMIPDLESPE
ncbi:hypothetical protein MMC17_001953 [Xylographa soralifera]|nr:hypothetical protein [Xylographa soralifera]